MLVLCLNTGSLDTGQCQWVLRCGLVENFLTSAPQVLGQILFDIFDLVVIETSARGGVAMHGEEL